MHHDKLYDSNLNLHTNKVLHTEFHHITVSPVAVSGIKSYVRWKIRFLRELYWRYLFKGGRLKVKLELLIDCFFFRKKNQSGDFRLLQTDKELEAHIWTRVRWRLLHTYRYLGRPLPITRYPLGMENVALGEQKLQSNDRNWNGLIPDRCKHFTTVRPHVPCVINVYP